MPTTRGIFVRKDSTRGTGPAEARVALAGLLTPAGDLSVVPGVISGATVTGRSTSPLWAYSVSAGHVVTTRGGTDGAVLWGLSGATDTPTVSAAPASGSRWDLIWVRHRDVDNADADSEAVLGVTSGTASGSPTKPYGSVPAGALVLAEAQVGAGATGTLHANVTITQVAPRVAARGGIISVATQAGLDRLSGIATSTAPILADLGGVLYRDSGAGFVMVAPPRVTGLGELTVGEAEAIVPGCTLSLPAGTWDVTATGYADWSTATAPRFTLVLRKGSIVAGSELDILSLYTAGVGGSVPFTLTAHGVALTSSTDVFPSAYRTAGVGGTTLLKNVKIKATRVA